MTKKWIGAGCLVFTLLLLASGCATGGRAKAAKVAIRVNCAAAEPYTDTAGNLWLADQMASPDADWGAVGGMTVDRGNLGITGVDAPKVYETERYSMESYKWRRRFSSRWSSGDKSRKMKI